MTISQSVQDSLCVKLRAVGLPKAYVLPIVDSVNRSVACEGAENVVKRLKVLKQAAVYSVSGLTPQMPWVAHDSNGVPKGPWRPVWVWLHSASHKHRKIAFNSLMVYASLTLPKDTGPTKTQERKFLGSAVQDGDVLGRRLEGTQVAKLVLQSVRPWLRQQFARTAATPPWNPDYPEIKEYCMQVYGSTQWDVAKSERMINNFLTGYAGQQFQCFPEIKQVLGEVGDDYFHYTHPWNGSWKKWEDAEPSTMSHREVKRGGRVDLVYDSIGVVGFSQEPGYKFRAFAAPNIVVQAALEPMKRYLLNLIREQPWDCTYDQDAGVRQVQKWLQDQSTVHAVDLSDATNNFPLTFTMSVLRSLNRIPESTLRLFELVSTSEYRLMWGDAKRAISWNVGQPLGTGPSFPAFALSHAHIALAAERLAGVPETEWGTSFLILGDDFVTNHDGVHEHYRFLLNRLGCPISEGKCLSSKVYSEFAGKLISADFVYHGFKYKEVSNRSFMDIVRTLGHTAMTPKILSKEQLAYCKLVQEFPEPYGLGFNPKGRSYEDRYREFLDVQELLLRNKRERPRTTRAELQNAFVYQATNHLFTNFGEWDATRINEVHQAERLPREPRSNLASLLIDSKVSTILEVVKREELTSTMLERGDPRPDPLLEVRTRDLSLILDKVRARSVVTPSLDSHPDPQGDATSDLEEDDGFSPRL